MKRILFGLFLIAPLVCAQTSGELLPPPVKDTPPVLSTGQVGGGYWSAGKRLQSVAQEMGLTMKVIESTGSRENIEQLMNPASPVSLAFAQADAIQDYVNRNPDAGENAELLENIGAECVFLLTASDSDLVTFDDLSDEAGELTVFIGSESSGIASTFQYLTEFEPKLKDAEVSYGDTTAAMQGLLSSSDSKNAVMVVHRPKAHSPEVDAAIENPGKIQFVSFEDEDFNATLSNGDDVYRPMRLRLPGSEVTVNTVCVKGYLIANKIKLDLEELNTLVDLVNFNWMRVYATP